MDMKSIRSTQRWSTGVNMLPAACPTKASLKQRIYSLSIHRQNHKVHGIPEDATRLTRLVLVRMLVTVQTIVLRYTVKKR